MSRKDSEMIVEAIFDSTVRAVRGGDKIEIRVLEAFTHANGSRGWAVIRKRVRLYKFQPNAFPISSPAKN